MAAFDTPWLASMSPASTYASNDGPSAPSYDPNPPTFAAFSPPHLSGAPTTSKQRSTIIVHKKSPLLAATPPPVTRALAYSHPFLLPLNKLAGLLSWSTNDPWESFLLVAGFWGVTLYGSQVLLWTGPILVVIGLILAMYSRRYSPLSSTSQTGEKHGRMKQPPDVTASHHKSLDEIVETLRIFTTRCNLLLEPFLSLTDFLSTQRTPTSATTRPALTTLFIRILLVTPLWTLLTLPPFYVLTPRRIILTFGTIALTWHSRPARVSRAILWRSLTVRRVCCFITGLSFTQDPDAASTSSTSAKLASPTTSTYRKTKSQENIASDLAMKHRPASPGVRFTFILYENQRRWIGLGWTSAMLAYERASWTDEHLNPAPSKDRFELPQVEDGTTRWRWVEGSTWKIEGGSTNANSPAKPSSKGTKSDAGTRSNDGGGWIYYDNKWNDGKRDGDSWGKYTRRRKWYRDAELVEVTPSTEVTPNATPNATPNEAAALSEADVGNKKKSASPKKDANQGKTHSSVAPLVHHGASDAVHPDDDVPPDSASSKARKRKGWFGGGARHGERRDSKSSGSLGERSLDSALSTRPDPDDDHVDQWKVRENDGARSYGLGEDAIMGLS